MLKEKDKAIEKEGQSMKGVRIIFISLFKMNQGTQWKELKEGIQCMKKGEPRFKHFEGNYLCLSIFDTITPSPNPFSFSDRGYL